MLVVVLALVFLFVAVLVFSGSAGAQNCSGAHTTTCASTSARVEILRKLAGPPSCPAPRFQVSALHPSLSQILRGLCHGRFHFAFYPILHLYVFFLFYLSLCLVLLIPTDPTNTLLVT